MLPSVRDMPTAQLLHFRFSLGRPLPFRRQKVGDVMPSRPEEIVEKSWVQRRTHGSSARSGGVVRDSEQADHRIQVVEAPQDRVQLGDLIALSLLAWHFDLHDPNLAAVEADPYGAYCRNLPREGKKELGKRERR